MHSRSRVRTVLQERRRELRLEAIVRSATRRKILTPAKKLDAADDLIRDAWSLHDAAKGTVARRRR